MSEKIGRHPDLLERLIGQKLLGKYRVDTFISAGGMGAVFKGFNVKLNHTVAIKILPPPNEVLELSPEGRRQTDDAIRRFRREGQNAVKVQNDHVVRVLDIDYDETLDVHFLVQEFIDGQSLREMLNDRRLLPLTEVVEIIRQTLEALEAIQEQGIVHRDLKPQNILLTKKQGRLSVKVCDFGISKLSLPVDGSDSTLSSLTAPWSLVGSAPYMSPEQCRCEETDARSDLYALGIITYEMLTGTVPFSGSQNTVLQGHLSKAPPPLRHHAANARAEHGLPSDVETFVAKALAKDADKRYQSATEMRQALEECRLKPGIAAATILKVACAALILGALGPAVYAGLQARKSSQTVVTESVGAAVRFTSVAPPPLPEPPVLKDEGLPTKASALEHMRRQEYSEAEKELETLLSRDPGNAELRYQLAQAYAPQPGKAKLATGAYRRYLDTPGHKHRAQVAYAKAWLSTSK